MVGFEHARPQPKESSDSAEVASLFNQCRIKTLGRTAQPSARRLQIHSSGANGKYVADFVCREAKLIVEVDGATHSTKTEIERDTNRTTFLEGLGYTVVRVQNDDVYNAMEGVLRIIREALESTGQ